MDAVRRLVEGVHRRVMLAVARAVVRLVDDSKKLQEVQLALLAGEMRGAVERFQNYGFTSVPHANAEAAVVFVGGNRDHGLVLAVDDRRYRVKSLQAGEVCIYTDEGDRIHLKRGRLVEVTTGTLKVTAAAKIELTAPEIEINAATLVDVNTPLLDANHDIKASGDVYDHAGTGDQRTMAGMRTIYNTHTHDENEVLGSPTDEPNELM